MAAHVQYRSHNVLAHFSKLTFIYMKRIYLCNKILDKRRFFFSVLIMYTYIVYMCTIVYAGLLKVGLGDFDSFPIHYHVLTSDLVQDEFLGILVRSSGQWSLTMSVVKAVTP